MHSNCILIIQNPPKQFPFGKNDDDLWCVVLLHRILIFIHQNKTTKHQNSNVSFLFYIEVRTKQKKWSRGVTLLRWLVNIYPRVTHYITHPSLTAREIFFEERFFFQNVTLYDIPNKYHNSYCFLRKTFRI